jgi:hypothetical protein
MRHHDALHPSKYRDSNIPAGDKPDAPVSSHSPRSTAKAVELLKGAIRPHNSGNPSCAEHDLICSHDGHHSSGRYREK